MDKPLLLTRIVATLEHDVDVLSRAAQTAYEAATAEENIAENKYDTLGLEASYLATGQARRTAEIRQALQIYQQLLLRDYDPLRGIQVSNLVTLEDEDGQQRRLFLGPEAAGLKIGDGDELVTVITPRSPLGQQLMGKRVDDEVSLGAQVLFISEVV
ncbi:GreA/GreB family elongation factor [Pseudomonas sp. SWRI59]|jgi:Transcription elongation factor, GreA/GreB, C-term.|uniref:GreA/GreB family elongation factor n=1 Tax=Pseudomonas TaxID=286 RepID=UPI000BA332A8|nr:MULTISPECIES: GreA/GreB family elongation factor [unclassified Pseudomonas]MBC3482436.1 GreA/GreB family elongation factor [Pseudomonas sp. SWRI77]MBC3500362.1 GreA/GreB family elongation factor [Pseudomonas sp. SWRI59]MBC3505691.1 GreA/GreB family elongation factor [Pseudomonas sp. SWRI68]MDD2129069.1 GreA/GreB family elongation factor [Pseudomonas sp. 17391]UDU82670.1 GreA/GreB family elongation factor [Pseudomonas sp. HN2-3]